MFLFALSALGNRYGVMYTCIHYPGLVADVWGTLYSKECFQMSIGTPSNTHILFRLDER